MIEPVSERRNWITSATSSGVGHFVGSLSGMSRRFCGVSMTLGAIALIVMFASAHSAHRLLVRWTTAAFIALVTATFGPVVSAGRFATSTTDAPFGLAASSGYA